MAPSPVIVVGVNAAICHIKVFIVDGEEQQWVRFASVVELHNISYCWYKINSIQYYELVSVFCRSYPVRNSHFFVRCVVSCCVVSCRVVLCRVVLCCVVSCCVVSCCYLRLVWPFHIYIFTHYFINGTIFGVKLLIIKCVFRVSVQLLSGTFLVLRGNLRHIIIHVQIEYPLFMSQFNNTLISWTDFRKKTSNINFMKIRPMWADFYENSASVSQFLWKFGQCEPIFMKIRPV